MNAKHERSAPHSQSHARTGDGTALPPGGRRPLLQQRRVSEVDSTGPGKESKEKGGGKGATVGIGENEKNHRDM